MAEVDAGRVRAREEVEEPADGGALAPAAKRARTSDAAAPRLAVLARGLPLDPLPAAREVDAATGLFVEDASVPHAPRRPVELTDAEKRLALRNALRYFPSELHGELVGEFAAELEQHGHIYMKRLRPTEYEMRAHALEDYPAACKEAAAIMLMIQNNLDARVAQFPHELVTYGGNGSVFQNWAQYHIAMAYLSRLTSRQTLVMTSGHPSGLFPSLPSAPRMVITNGMVIPNYSSKSQYEKMFATGVSMYGQMTAGSYCYIGPQGIVHGTTITVLNAGRKYLGKDDLRGVVYVSSGLGGMSGAQAKAAVICGAIGVLAEVDEVALLKRHEQGWVQEVCRELPALLSRIREARRAGEPLSIGFHGNCVDVWEALAAEEELLVELGSDQTSLHNPFHGGYYPVGMTVDEARQMMVDDHDAFCEAVRASLRRQVAAINKLVARGMRFWDYGNSFLLEASRAGADIMAADGDSFRYPSYVQDIMGDIFSLGFGPFRWVCTSGDAADLAATDAMAGDVLEAMAATAPPRVAAQLSDNLYWIRRAEENKLVVGSQARILYADAEARAAIAAKFNDAIKEGTLKAPVVLSRDHHDVSGTDSPYRETSNITDGSKFCADMAVQNVIGDASRGATWVALHNGGGVGWGEVINGGFGMLLDGSDEAGDKAARMLFWDVNNGVTRRAWGRNKNALFAIRREMERTPDLEVTLPSTADDALLSAALGMDADREEGEESKSDE